MESYSYRFQVPKGGKIDVLPQGSLRLRGQVRVSKGSVPKRPQRSRTFSRTVTAIVYLLGLFAPMDTTVISCHYDSLVNSLGRF